MLFYCPKYLVLKESPFYVDARVSIECVCTQGESGKYQNVDITALVQAGELLQTLTERRAKDPARILSMTLALGEDEE